MEQKEYKYMCDCGALYKFHGTSEEMEDFLNADFWLCELGRHFESGRISDYLTLVEVSEKLSDLKGGEKPYSEGDF